MTFEFLERNKIITTANLSSTSNVTVNNRLIDRKPNIQYLTSGENSDVNTATIAYHTPSTTLVSYVLLQNHNFKDFKITYNSGTALSPAFAVTGNTYSNTLFIFATTSVTNLEVHCDKTFVTNDEKRCGQFIVANLAVRLDSNPESAGFTPSLYKKGIEYELTDGGIVSVFLSSKYRANIDLDYVSSSTVLSLTALWKKATDFIFVPHPVATFTSEWNGEAYAVNWIGDFELLKFRDNNLNAYQGGFSIAQIPD